MQLVGHPIITLSDQAGVHFGEILDRERFRVIKFDRDNDDEDQLLIQEIEACDPTEIGGIILVSGDADFYDVLRAKHVQGISIMIVAALINDSNGQRRVAPSLSEGEFTFIDLAPYRDQLIYQPLKRKPSVPTAVPAAPTNKVEPVSRQIRIKIEVPPDTSDEKWRLVLERVKQLIGMPGIRSRLTIESVSSLLFSRCPSLFGSGLFY
jgi:hypothetical protein